MRDLVELHWPALLVSSACVGLALSNWIPGAGVAVALLAAAGVLMLVLGGTEWRLVAFGLVLAALGLWWGSLRVEAMARSVLASEVGTSGEAELVVSGPARPTAWSVRALAEVRSFRGRPLHERVLLVLPAGRSPPRGAVLEAAVRVAEPHTATTEGGFDEKAWLERQAVHVVLRASSWHEVGRRGGIEGVGDRLRDRVERAVGRGTTGVRRALVLGVVLGEDEGLSDRVRLDFRRSGLYHLLAVSGQNVAFIALGIYGLGWLLRLPRLARELVVLAAIASYVLAVGWQPSVVRAGVAGALASLAWIVARPKDRWHFLAVGALILLVWAPPSVLEPGFQLSFAAVGAIFVGLPRVQRVAEGYPVPRRLAEALGVAVVCGAVTAPIVLVQFHSAPRVHGPCERPRRAGDAVCPCSRAPLWSRRSRVTRGCDRTRVARRLGRCVARARRAPRLRVTGRLGGSRHCDVDRAGRCCSRARVPVRAISSRHGAWNGDRRRHGTRARRSGRSLVAPSASGVACACGIQGDVPRRRAG